MANRRYKRYIVEGMDVHTKTDFIADIQMLDISKTGARFKSERSLLIGGKYTIKLDTESKLLSLDCHVVWENISGTIINAAGEVVPIYQAGVEFMNVSHTKLLDLEDFIEEFATPDEERVLDEHRLKGMRFIVQTHEDGMLHYKDSYNVKKLSLGGMLVETTYAIELDKRLSMELFLPNDQFPIVFEGRIASCTEIPDMRLNRFDIGVEFMSMPEEGRSRIIKFLVYLSGLDASSQ